MCHVKFFFARDIPDYYEYERFLDFGRKEYNLAQKKTPHDTQIHESRNRKLTLGCKVGKGFVKKCRLFFPLLAFALHAST